MNFLSSRDKIDEESCLVAGIRSSTEIQSATTVARMLDRVKKGARKEGDGFRGFWIGRIVGVCRSCKASITRQYAYIYETRERERARESAEAVDGVGCRVVSFRHPKQPDIRGDIYGRKYPPRLSRRRETRETHPLARNARWQEQPRVLAK